MVVHAGVQAEPDGAADRLGHLALVHGPEARVDRALDAPVRRHVLGDDGEVLPVNASLVSKVLRLPVSSPVPPFSSIVFAFSSFFLPTSSIFLFFLFLLPPPLGQRDN